MYNYYIFQDGILKATFLNQNNDTTIFGWLLRNQGQSTSYAFKYGGWSVECYDNKKEITLNYSTDEIITQPKFLKLSSEDINKTIK